MNFRSLLAPLALAAGLAASTHAAAAETQTVAIQQKLPNAPGKTLTALRVDFPPGVKAAPHRHGQAFVFAYVLQGRIRSQVNGAPAQVYGPGESWHELPGSHHTLTENVSTTEPATLLAVFVADDGAALKVDDPR